MALAGSLAAQPSPRRYVVASFVGDKLDIVGAAMQTGTRLSNNSRTDVRDGEAALDKVVLAAVADAIERADRRAAVALLSVPPSRLHDSPESMLQADGVALPGAVLDVIDKQKATHVLLVTKLGGDAAFAMQNTMIGSGKVRGLGFSSADQAASPWLALSAQEKVDRLSALVRRAVGPAAESLIADR